MKEPTVSEIATEVLKALGSSMSGEVKKLFQSASKYVGDTYYDETTTIFDDKYDIKIQPLPKEFQMRTKNFISPTDLALDQIKPINTAEFDKMVNDLKIYAKNIDTYAKPPDTRVFHNVNDMLMNMRQHVNTYGPTLIVDDDPNNSYFGYRCKDTQMKWRISHDKVFEYLGDPDHTLDVLDIHYLNYGEGTKLNENTLNTFVKKILHIKNEYKYKNPYIENVLDKIYAETFDGNVWQDAFAMFEDIIQHAKNNGSEITADFPSKNDHNRFVCERTGRWWEIPLSIYNAFDVVKKFGLPRINTHTHLMDYLNGKHNEINKKLVDEITLKEGDIDKKYIEDIMSDIEKITDKISKDMDKSYEIKDDAIDDTKSKEKPINTLLLLFATALGGFLTTVGNQKSQVRVEDIIEEEQYVEQDDVIEENKEEV